MSLYRKLRKNTDIYLEDSKQRNRKGVEVGRWCAILEVELSSEQLHAE